MYHTIEFLVDLMLDIERSPRHPLEQTLVRRGTRVQAQIRPYVTESDDGPIEVADLFFADGTATRMIPFEHLELVD